VNALTEILRARIAEGGPLSFSEFMAAALYHPEHGYYRRARDPFGREGDFFTAAQLQPVFGRLVAQEIARLRDGMGAPAEFEVWDLGAGRGEMREALAPFAYRAIDAGDEWPERLTGVVFANELFDALPVDAARRCEAGFVEMRVAWEEGRFVWTGGPALAGAALEYALRHAPEEEDARFEIPCAAFPLLNRLAAVLDRGYILAIDYGYTRAERLRFPAGTLMSYRRHRALDDVLAAPGACDITAHVPFDALSEYAARRGLRRVRFESLAAFLLRVGEADQFAAALDAGSEPESRRLVMQLKTLLAGMGETFRCLLWEKSALP
jgi:SAM-dependent MidA family methyltransferase